MSSRFLDKLRAAQQRNRSYLCVGLDIVIANNALVQSTYDEPMLPFAREIIAATRDLVCAYKPNLAFFMAEGAAGMIALERIVRLIPDDIPIILDAKLGDIGNTAEAYARGVFEQYKADAVTIAPYMGIDSVKPFLSYLDRGAFVLARTSNANAGEFQNLSVAGDDGRSQPLYERVAQHARRWHAEGPGACGLVVGATAPEEMVALRKQAPELPFLIPGVGAQGGDLAFAVKHGRTADGLGPVISASRSILYASKGVDYAEAARAAALSMVEQMRAA
jgi:orotidine-5'-phosphate decarboxylase